VPKNILTQPEMQMVLWDMIRADKFLTDFVFIKDTSLDKDTARINFYQQVFSIHHISEEKFKKSFDYYKAHPTLLKAILDSLDKRSGTTSAPAEEYKFQPVTDTSRFLKKSGKPKFEKQ
jgi:hypothetical protein